MPGTFSGAVLDPVLTPHFVEDYGAIGDGITDDTQAIRDAIDAAVTAAVNDQTWQAVVRFRPVTYLVDGALVQGGTTKGNAIIPLPVIADTDRKITLTLVGGAVEGSALPHWNQPDGQRSGTVLLTTQAGTDDVTFGSASVIGGPTVPQGYGPPSTYSNMMFAAIGISISVPSDPHIGGFDLGGVAEANLWSCSAFTATGPPNTVPATSGWDFGVRMPYTGNNANNHLLFWSCEGFTYGCVISELTVAFSIRCVYCIVGIGMDGGRGSSTPHRAAIFFATVQWCKTSLGAISTSAPLKLDVWMLDIETAGGAIQLPDGFGMFKLINDPNNVLQGSVGIDAGGIAGVNPDYIAGATGLRIEALNIPAGAVDPPAVPASGTPLVNPFLRNATVSFWGGDVTAVMVDGQTISLTGGTVRVPSQKTITLTYTSTAPAWAWTLD